MIQMLLFSDLPFHVFISRLQNSSLALVRLSLRPAVTLVRLTPATLPTNFANAARLMTRILARGAIPRRCLIFTIIGIVAPFVVKV